MTDKLPPMFGDLPREEQEKLVIAEGLDDAQLEYLGVSMWKTKRHSGFNKKLIYRLAPTKPSVDWSHLSDEIICISRDKDGRAWAHTEVPKQYTEVFRGGGIHYAIDHLSFYDPGTCPWEESVVMRPGYETDGVGV